ncbi:Siderophore synthetase component [Halobacillus alkaliphilus]|uniref:Siderophore synthetase component n=1 Tax=Halobacillus alkaliphilus TaxID=396056 RepID=A0A1I2LYF7_9BACI|nr:IucA/IucC family protein [Halobacillus alkaliphilus]SFF83598.1 Siderophore synthetase component [Halobacillus alkaliphilus]
MEETMRATSFIQNEYPQFIKTYPANAKAAEKIILHQLVQAIIREQIVHYERSGDSSAFSIPLKKGGTLYIKVSKRYWLGHIDIEGYIRHVDEKGNERPVHSPEDCLDLLFEDEQISSNQAAFYQEIKNSVVNYGLALTIAEERTCSVKKEARRLQASDAFSYALKKKQESPSFSPLTFFEQWVIQGHTIHPCSRTRLGISLEDMTQYAPEWGGSPCVIPLAVHHKFSRMTSMDEQTVKSIVFREYPHVKKAFEKMCVESQLDPEDYEIIPVHPWQFRHTLPVYYQEALEKKKIIPLEDAGIKTSALISFRTLAPHQDRVNHHIKTAVNVQMTSAIRTVSAASTQNGPTLSKLFKQVLINDAYLARSLSIMSEPSGIHYEPEETVTEEERHFLQKNMAAILRENPENTLAEDEIAVPAASLLAESPLTGGLMVEELIYRQEKAAIKEAATSFIREYARALLPGIITLITKYGISMEAHLQNCVVVFKNGQPQRVILRDHGGIRIMNERLNRFFSQQPIDPSTNVLTEQREELLDIFSHAVLHNHLGEIIVALVRHSGVEEDALWGAVERVLRQVYASLEEDPLTAEAALEDAAIIFSSPSRMKALVQMRLLDQYTENLYVDMANPFHQETRCNQL